MIKPDKPGELINVNVKAISLVSEAANGEKFKIFKSAETDEKEAAPEAVEKNERGLFHILKEFFTGKAEFKKGDVANIYRANESGVKLFDAFSALMKVLGLSRYGDETLNAETDPAKIISAIDDFRNVAIEILLGKAEIAKSGRKISSDRLGRLKNIQAALNELLSGLDENDTSKEMVDLTKEEVQKTVEEAIKAVNVEKSIEGALAPIIERLEKVENVRGISNRVPEESSIEKSSNDFWRGIF